MEEKLWWCNTHGDFWGDSYAIAYGEGYYLEDSIMQRTGAMQDFFDEMQKLSITGSFGWIVCERCVDRLRLSEDEKDIAKSRAIERWNR